MSAAHLLLKLHQDGIRLDVENGRLKVRANGRRIDDPTRQAIRRHKAALIRLCTPSPTAGISKVMAQAGIPLDVRRDLQEQFLERLAICIIDGGMTEAEAVKVAFDQVKAEVGQLAEQSSQKQASYVRSDGSLDAGISDNPSETPKRTREAVRPPAGDSGLFASGSTYGLPDTGKRGVA